MKRLVVFLALCILVSSVFAGIQKTMSVYVKEGRYPADVIVDAIDSATATVAPKIRSAIDTMSQMQFRPVYTSLQPSIATATGDDSIYYACFTVPAGMTATIRAITLSAAVEYDVANPATVELMIVNNDVSGSDIDTIVIPISIDEDSVVYNNVALALTLTDTAAVALGAGDVVQAYVMGDSTLDVVCEGCVLTFDLDFDE